MPYFLIVGSRGRRAISPNGSYPQQLTFTKNGAKKKKQKEWTGRGAHGGVGERGEHKKGNDAFFVNKKSKKTPPPSIAFRHKYP